MRSGSLGLTRADWLDTQSWCRLATRADWPVVVPRRGLTTAACAPARRRSVRSSSPPATAPAHCTGPCYAQRLAGPRGSGRAGTSRPLTAPWLRAVPQHARELRGDRASGGRAPGPVRGPAPGSTPMRCGARRSGGSLRAGSAVRRARLERESHSSQVEVVKLKWSN
jgi:hypothetical protein